MEKGGGHSERGEGRGAGGGGGRLMSQEMDVFMTKWGHGQQAEDRRGMRRRQRTQDSSCR
jgi:hypothetical protein